MPIPSTYQKQEPLKMHVYRVGIIVRERQFLIFCKFHKDSFYVEAWSPLDALSKAKQMAEYNYPKEAGYFSHAARVVEVVS